VVSRATKRRVAGAAAAIGVAAGCGWQAERRLAPVPTAGAAERVGSAGVTVALPSGWHTSAWDDGNVTDPLTRIVVASAPVSRAHTGCQVARYAFADDAVALVVVEWNDPRVVRRPRPGRFTAETLAVMPPPAVECFDGSAGTSFFTDGGRAFGAYLLAGRDAPPALVDEARRVLDSLRVDTQRLERNGIAIAVPRGWSGRILFTEPTGPEDVTFQVGNFELPPNEGLEPPRQLAPGEEDPIKAMAAGDVLIMILDGASGGAEAPQKVSVGDLEPVEGPRVPQGHWLAAESFCFGPRCVRIEVDFGMPEPGSRDFERVDAVLASLTVAT
jgi:hypothetical protein